MDRKVVHHHNVAALEFRNKTFFEIGHDETTLSSQIFPDLNPIEQAFSKLKAHLRKAAERTIPRLSRRIGALVAAFSPQECTNYWKPGRIFRLKSP